MCNKMETKNLQVFVFVLVAVIPCLDSAVVDFGT